MKRLLTAILLLAQTQLPAQPIAWQKAKAGIEAMLAGKAPLSYTEAIYLTENAWYDNQVDHELYTAVLQHHLNNIAQLAAANHHKTISDYHSSLTQGTAAAQYTAYQKALINWAIYTYMTDTALWLEGKTLYSHLPYSYSRQDPMGTANWQHTQVMHLLASHTGNCYALASLYRIFSEQLGSEAALCTAPGHIYISHADDKGVKYNIELTGHSFPGTGSLQALSYSTTTAVKNGIALRQLNDTAAIALSLVYLAKGYEYKYSSKGTNYALQCAETALQYDPQNLNAMLLKAEVLEHRLQAAGKPIAALKHTQDYTSYEQLLGRLYTLGYREMPADMKNILVAAARRDYINTTPPADKERYATISAGLFDEEHKTKATEQYGNTLLNTRSLQIERFILGTALYNNYDFDPVVFAWNMDPLTGKYPNLSPYSSMNGNPILFGDINGDNGIAFWETDGKKKTIVIRANYHYINGAISEEAIKGVQRMYSSKRNINYNNEKVNVRFEINFIPEKEGTNLSVFNGTDGENSLTIGSGFDPNTPELSNFANVSLDKAQIEQYSATTPTKEVLTLDKQSQLKYLISCISHGIGHNIGLIHADEGIMLDQSFTTRATSFKDASGNFKSEWALSFSQNLVTKENVTNLVERIDEMSEKGSDYWKEKPDETTRRTGTTNWSGLKQF